MRKSGWAAVSVFPTPEFSRVRSANACTDHGNPDGGDPDVKAPCGTADGDDEGNDHHQRIEQRVAGTGKPLPKRCPSQVGPDARKEEDTDYQCDRSRTNQSIEENPDLALQTCPGMRNQEEPGDCQPIGDEKDQVMGSERGNFHKLGKSARGPDTDAGEHKACSQNSPGHRFSVGVHLGPANDQGPGHGRTEKLPQKTEQKKSLVVDERENPPAADDPECERQDGLSPKGSRQLRLLLACHQLVSAGYGRLLGGFSPLGACLSGLHLAQVDLDRGLSSNLGNQFREIADEVQDLLVGMVESVRKPDTRLTKRYRRKRRQVREKATLLQPAAKLESSAKGPHSDQPQGRLVKRNHWKPCFDQIFSHQVDLAEERGLTLDVLVRKMNVGHSH